MLPLRPARVAARALAAVLLASAAQACGGSGTPEIRLVQEAARSYVEVAPVGRQVRRAASGLAPSSPEWHRVLRVQVRDDRGGEADAPVAGKYSIEGDSLRFAPLFPFDPGRSYVVRFYGAPDGSTGPPIEQAVALPAEGPAPPTRVTGVYPSGDVIPENQLRFYIHFSAPMGRRGGLSHVRLLDEHGAEVVDPFLPLEAEFWNGDRTRYTVFFDPGRQKRGIRPNRELGPSLVAGRRYTLEVARSWIDGHGRPLAETFTRRFTAGPPATGALDCGQWRVTAPEAGTRAPLVVSFPAPLDHGLLMRAVGVRRDGRPIVGEVRTAKEEREWILTPAEPWQAGRHDLVALSFLEDLAGNRIGRPFEVDRFDRVDDAGEPAVTTIPFTVSSSPSRP